MNLLLTRACPEACSFCYAGAWRAAPADPAPAARILGYLGHYARLVAEAGPPPVWRAVAPDEERLRTAAGVVNLLGGEPTLHPEIGAIVRGARGLGLGVHLFTNGARPEVVRNLADALWFVTINGRFAGRAPELGVALARVSAQVPLRPGDDPAALLEAVWEAGLRSAVLAIAAPAGDAAGPFFSAEDLAGLAEVVGRTRAAGARLGLTLAWDCAFPRCLDPVEGAARCLPVPVLDDEGLVGACAGAYHGQPRRPLASFASLAALHAFTTGIHRALTLRPHRVAACAACDRLGQDCQGLCLGWRG